MAITRTETKVKYSTNNTVTITTGSNNTSDLVALDPTCVEASVTLKADNQGTPADGDTVDFYFLGSSGDPDGAAVGDEFATADLAHAQHLGQIDTFTSDPAIITVPYPATPQAGKIYSVNNGASSVIVGAVVEETRAA